jgi:hypothetical protein
MPTRRVDRSVRDAATKEVRDAEATEAAATTVDAVTMTSRRRIPQRSSRLWEKIN